jgi:acyl-coenzyme A thioesterase PaaI-like protein
MVLPKRDLRSRQPASIISAVSTRARFTLGEATSWAAMAGAFASQILAIRPVAGLAEIEYTRIANGVVIATARLTEATDTVRTRLEAEGKSAFNVEVSLSDEAGEEVAKMKVTWHVKKTG